MCTTSRENPSFDSHKWFGPVGGATIARTDPIVAQASFGRSRTAKNRAGRVENGRKSHGFKLQCSVQLNFASGSRCRHPFCLCVVQESWLSAHLLVRSWFPPRQHQTTPRIRFRRWQRPISYFVEGSGSIEIRGPFHQNAMTYLKARNVPLFCPGIERRHSFRFPATAVIFVNRTVSTVALFKWLYVE